MHRKFTKTNPPRKVIGVYDPLSAISAEQAGADALWLSSYSYSVSQGLPDLGLLPFSAEQAALLRISTAVNIPVFVDVDNAYGALEHALIIAKRAHDAGAAGICIEDKMSPKISSLYSGDQSILDIKLYAEIIQTIKSEVAGLDVWARLEGLNHQESVADVRQKIQICHNAGANCILVHNTKSTVSDLIDTIKDHDDVRIGVIPTNFMTRLHELEDQNLYAIVLANQLMRAAHRTFLEVTDLLLKDPVEVESRISPIKKINRLV